MENGPLKMYFLLKMGHSIAMLDYQRVVLTFHIRKPVFELLFFSLCGHCDPFFLVKLQS